MLRRTFQSGSESGLIAEADPSGYQMRVPYDRRTPPCMRWIERSM